MRLHEIVFGVVAVVLWPGGRVACPRLRGHVQKCQDVHMPTKTWACHPATTSPRPRTTDPTSPRRRGRQGPSPGPYLPDPRARGVAHRRTRLGRSRQVAVLRAGAGGEDDQIHVGARLTDGRSPCRRAGPGSAPGRQPHARRPRRPGDPTRSGPNGSAARPSSDDAGRHRRPPRAAPPCRAPAAKPHACPPPRPRPHAPASSRHHQHSITFRNRIITTAREAQTSRRT